MGTFEAHIQPERDYADVPFEEIVDISEGKYPALALLSAGVRVDSWNYRCVKRAIDILGALLMLAIAIIPGLFIAAAIVLTSRGPIFYRELRVGRGGRFFRIWKFRSMCHATKLQTSVKVGHSGGTLLHWRIHKHHRDPRITRVGGFLRRWSLDELPRDCGRSPDAAM
jgi:exopolysaccharide production protein ExoY